jgi:hypothetical protein
VHVNPGSCSGEQGLAFVGLHCCVDLEHQVRRCSEDASAFSSLATRSCPSRFSAARNGAEELSDVSRRWDHSRSRRRIGGRGLGAANGHGVLIGFSDLSACADTAREIGLEWCVQVQPAELQHVEMWTQIIDTALWEETA